jgi:hypothetical protein
MPEEISRKNRKKFEATYKEHIYAIRNNQPSTGYSKRALDRGHTYGNIGNTKATVRKARKENTRTV